MSTTDSTIDMTPGVSSKMSAQTKPVLIILGIVLVIIGLTSFLLNQKESRQGAAQTALYLAMKSVAQETKATTTGAVAVRFKTSIDQLSKVSHDFSGARAAYEAELKLGDLYFDNGEAASSIKWYESATRSAPRGFERMLAFYALAYAYEATQKYPEALKSLEKAQNQGEGLKAEILLSMARVHGLMKDNGKAISTYDQVIAQFPNSEYARDAETQKSFVK